jgi:hypothetical protein
MAVIKPLRSRSIRGAMTYISKVEKTTVNLMSGVNCSSEPKKALQQMQINKKIHGKTDGRSCMHFVQSFAAEEAVTAEEVHQLGLELVNRCKLMQGYQIFITTHLDQKNKNLHNHILISSVNVIDGKKWQMSANELADLRRLGDDICREHGLSITVKGQTFNQQKNEEPSIYVNETYRILHRADEGKADSWVYNTARDILDTMRLALNKDHFCELLNKAGVKTIWSDSRKNITFQRAEGIGKSGKAAQKIRDSKLAQYFKIDFCKEFFENEFNQNLQRAKAAGRVGRVVNTQRGGNAEIAGRIESSICEDRSIEQLRLDVAASAAARAERKRAERERQEADERARSETERQRAEREAAERAARATEKQKKATRSRGSSIAD